jgi:hypothetical protein
METEHFMTPNYSQVSEEMITDVTTSPAGRLHAIHQLHISYEKIVIYRITVSVIEELHFLGYYAV